MTRLNPTNQETPPGAIVGVVGTVAAIAGAAVILFNWQSPDYQDGFFVGGLLVVGGLLLRIESAIRGRVSKIWLARTAPELEIRQMPPTS